MKTEHQIFDDECKVNANTMSAQNSLNKTSNDWICQTAEHKYTYNFKWMGLPIIQFPQDIIAMQELIWELKPDLIIETGIARGGSLVFYASLLEMNASCGGSENAEVLGIDIDIRPHNRQAIEAHPMFKRIQMIEGSSISSDIIKKVKIYTQDKKQVLVVLDSNHTHEHVLAEINAYAPLVTVGSYCVVFDTVVEDMPENSFPDRPWGKGNNPKTAVWEFMQQQKNFIIDKSVQNKLLITVAPDGYLKRVK